MDKTFAFIDVYTNKFKMLIILPGTNRYAEVEGDGLPIEDIAERIVEIAKAYQVQEVFIDRAAFGALVMERIEKSCPNIKINTIAPVKKQEVVVPQFEKKSYAFVNISRDSYNFIHKPKYGTPIELREDKIPFFSHVVDKIVELVNKYQIQEIFIEKTEYAIVLMDRIMEEANHKVVFNPNVVMKY